MFCASAVTDAGVSCRQRRCQQGHMLFKHLPFLPLLLLPFARSLAADTLISNPNLSAFHPEPRPYSYTVDPTNGWGVARPGPVRVMGFAS